MYPGRYTRCMARLRHILESPTLHHIYHHVPSVLEYSVWAGLAGDTERAKKFLTNASDIAPACARLRNQAQDDNLVLHKRNGEEVIKSLMRLSDHEEHQHAGVQECICVEEHWDHEERSSRYVDNSTFNSFCSSAHLREI
jgi:hypothetical protein